MKNLDKRKLLGVIVSPIMIMFGAYIMEPYFYKYYQFIEAKYYTRLIAEIPPALFIAIWITIWLRFMIAMFRPKGKDIHFNVYPLVFSILFVIFFFVKFSSTVSVYGEEIPFTILLLSLSLCVEKK